MLLLSSPLSLAVAHANGPQSEWVRVGGDGSYVHLKDRIFSPETSSELIAVLDSSCDWTWQLSSNRSSCQLPIETAPAVRTALQAVEAFWNVTFSNPMVTASWYQPGFKGWPVVHEDSHELSAVVYLSTVSRGGELLFPHMDPPLEIRPQAGQVVTWSTPQAASDMIGQNMNDQNLHEIEEAKKALRHTVAAIPSDSASRYAIQIQGVKEAAHLPGVAGKSVSSQDAHFARKASSFAVPRDGSAYKLLPEGQLIAPKRSMLFGANSSVGGSFSNWAIDPDVIVQWG